ncbi:MAG: hypothetical protein E6J90_07155 [Deltaproteobacteria bacterium]|nr:MAG: hypothetical protein E6J91_00635 [Deltaproteobacteria bacterium]TMQ24841.1 MAG: hypothetical protein E6J90_07155 [Deltaproteobacteria bacterium]
MLRAKAEASRGTVTVAAHGAPSTEWPHTTSRDAFTIALVFDTAIDEHASGAIVARWIIESDLLAGEPEGSTEPYLGNRSFWEMLAAATIELDRVRAPLPALSVIDDAMRELETARPAAAREPRNASRATLVTVLAEPSWKAMALRQLEFFRALRGETIGFNPFAPTVPATCNADVLALTDYWTEQLARVGHSASDTYHRLLYSCWREVQHRVLRDVKHAPAHEPCEHNPEFWTALLLLTTQSDACDAAPMPWAFHVPESCHHQRNAAPVDTGATLDFPAARTWDDAARMQRDEFARLRGEDVVTGRLVTHVPRTTVADVRQLAAYWSAGLAKAGEHNVTDVSYRHVVDRWKAALAEIDRIPLNVDPSSVYAHNTDFWEALMTIAIQVAVTAEAPSRWQLLKDATVQAVKDLPHTLRTAAQELVSDVLARPLMSIGIGLGGIALALLLLRRSGHESRHE